MHEGWVHACLQVPGILTSSSSLAIGARSPPTPVCSCLDNPRLLQDTFGNLACAQHSPKAYTSQAVAIGMDHPVAYTPPPIFFSSFVRDLRDVDAEGQVILIFMSPMPQLSIRPVGTCRRLRRCQISENPPPKQLKALTPMTTGLGNTNHHNPSQHAAAQQNHSTAV